MKMIMCDSSYLFLSSSFGMSENYFIFLEQPIYLNLKRVFMNKITGQPLLRDFFQSNHEEKVRTHGKKLNICIISPLPLHLL